MSRERRRTHGRCPAAALFALSLALVLVTACNQPPPEQTGQAVQTTPVATAGAAASLNAVSSTPEKALVPVAVSLNGAPRLSRVRLYDAETGAAAVSRDRVIALHLSFENRGEQSVTYSPPHARPSSVTNPIPQLWGIKSETLSGEVDKEVIPRTTFQGGAFNVQGQLLESHELKPASSLEDLYVFDSTNAKLYKHYLLLVPATLFGGKAEDVVSLTFPAPAPEAYAPIDYDPPAALKEWITVGDLRLRITRVEIGPATLTRPGQAPPEGEEAPPPTTTKEESFLKVFYEVENTSDEDLAFQPPYMREGGEAPGLTLREVYEDSYEHSPLIKLTLTGDWQIEGRVPAEGRRNVNVPAGQKVSDILLFDLPTDPARLKNIYLTFSSHLFDGDEHGLMIFTLDPPKPPPEPAPEAPEDGADDD